MKMRAPAAGPPFHADPAGLPAVPGAYVLLVVLERGLDIVLPRRLPVHLPPGRYLYCGSARGPGGLKGRLSRHLRPDGKTVRWHIDRLTQAGRAAGAWIFPGGDECALVARLAALPVPIAGFGASDCRICGSHLLAWPQGQTLPADWPPPR